MDQIGNITGKLLAKVSQPTPSNSLARLADTSKAPTTVDRLADVVLPQRLFSAWAPAIGPREVARALLPTERAVLERRRDELAAALAPHADHERAAAKAAISAMLGGFRQMRQQGADVVAVAEITRIVLREFPLWAIKQGCGLIASGASELDRHWPPSDGEIAEVVRDVIRYHRRTLDRCKALLTAEVEQPDPPRKTRAEVEAEVAAMNLAHVPPADTGYMARVEADLEARRQRREGGSNS